MIGHRVEGDFARPVADVVLRAGDLLAILGDAVGGGAIHRRRASEDGPEVLHLPIDGRVIHAVFPAPGDDDFVVMAEGVEGDAMARADADGEVGLRCGIEFGERSHSVGGLAAVGVVDAESRVARNGGMIVSTKPLALAAIDI